MGTAEGARKAREHLSNYSEEQQRAWKSKGGKAKVPKGFATDRSKAVSAGRLSGHVRRMKRNNRV